MRAQNRPRPARVRERNCTTCHRPTPTTDLLGGVCPECAGQTTLPLRGAGGQFLPGLNPTRATARVSGRGRTDRTTIRSATRVVVWVRAVVLVASGLVLADCDGPMFPDGLLPPGIRAGALIGPTILTLTAAVVVLAAGTAVRHRPGVAR